MKLTTDQILQQAITAHKEERFEEAEKFYYSALEAQPTNLDAHNNLGVLLTTLGKFDEAIARYKKAIELKPDYTEAHFNLGIALNEHGKLDEAEICFKKVIELKPNYAEACNNLGNTLLKLSKFDEAEASYRKAIEFKPDYIEAHNNLGNLFNEHGKFNEAEASYRKAIEFKPDYAEACNNLGAVLHDRGIIDEAEKNFKKALQFDIDPSKKIKIYQNLDRISKQKELLFNIQQINDSKNKTKVSFIKKENTKSLRPELRLLNDIFTSELEIKEDLINDLYNLESYTLTSRSKTLKKYPRYGNGIISDFRLFEKNFASKKNLEKSLKEIMRQAVNSDIFIMESFFNIMSAGSGSSIHKHINYFDLEKGLINQKFSLVYYPLVGDQNCSESGILKLYDPDQEFLPKAGQVIIFPANRYHSSIYNGKKDRVMIGVNFYSLP